MAIKNYQGDIERNLQEQVDFLTDRVIAHYEVDRTLADYGIKIIGFYDTIDDAKDDLGDPYDGPYGNAVGIGISAPYSFYIWTRANNLSDVDYWQNVGELAVVGPQGEDGKQGDPGEPGQPAHILVGNGFPAVAGKENDIYITTGGDQNLIGNVYKIVDGQWVQRGNIRGVEGAPGKNGSPGPALTFDMLTSAQKEQLKGDKGETGDPGGFIKISGILTDLGELPNPTVLKDLEVAFLHGTQAPYDLWMQVGPNYEQAIWTNMGPLNTATYVSVGGQYQGIWDADTKLDKITTPAIDGGYKVYAVDDIGDQATIDFTGSVESHAGVMRGGYGEIYVPEWPEFPNEATSKMYVDGLIVDSPTIKTMWEGPDLSLNLSADIVADIGRSVKLPIEAPDSIQLLGVKPDGTQGLYSYASFATTSQFIYSTKTTTTTSIPMKTGYKYTFYAYGSSQLTLTYTIPGQTASTSASSIQRAELMVLGTNQAMLTLYSASFTASIPVSKLASVAGGQFITLEVVKQGSIQLA